MNENNRTLELLEEILLWMKYDYLETKKKLIETLDSEEKILAYELSDGNNSSRDVAKMVKVDPKTVRNWWQKWFEEGLVEQTKKYRGNIYKQLCSLTKMGIEIPSSEGIVND